MNSEPVYVTFEFNGNLSEEVDRVTLGIKGLRDESKETFRRLLSDSDAAFSSMSEENRRLAVAVQQDIVALRQLGAAQDALDAEFRAGALTLEAYAQAKARLATGEAELHARITQQTAAIAAQNTALRETAATAALPVAGFNTLNFSVQQVARELPSLTMGAQMFFLAISNNLPILADNIKKARTEYAALTAAGQKATPVWKQILSSITSWQTALVLGITLLVMYGKEIVQWTSGLLKGSSAAEEAARKQKAFNEALAESYRSVGEQIVAVKKLQEEWNSLGSSLEGKKKFVVENKDSFDKLGVAVSNVKDAENLLVDNTGAFIDAMKLRAQAVAAEGLAAGQYKKELELREKAKQARENTQLPFLQQQSKFLNPGYDAVFEEKRREEYAEKVAAGIEKEADAAKRAAESYFDLASAKTAEADATLKAAGIASGGNGESAGEANREKAALSERLREIKEMQEKIRRGNLEAELELRQEEIGLMDESLEKTLRQTDLNYDRRIAEIAKKGEELIKAHGEVERKAWEAAHPKWQEEGLTPPAAIASVDALLPEEQRYLEDRAFLAREQRLKDITEAERKAAEEIESIRAESNKKFLSDLENELNGIDQNYAERIKKAREAGAKEEEIRQLAMIREKEKDAARSDSFVQASLERIRIEEDANQKILESREQGDILYQIKKNRLEEKYARLRLDVLKKAYATANSGRQEALKEEIEILSGAVEAYGETGKALKKELVATILEGLSGIASAAAEADESLKAMAETMSRLTSIAGQLLSKDYIGAAVTFVTTGVSAIAEQNAAAIAAAKQSEAAYWDAVNYKIERQIELMKELQGVTKEEAGESVQQQIDALQKTIQGYDFTLNQGQFDQMGSDIGRGFATAEDEFTRNLLQKFMQFSLSGTGQGKKFHISDALEGLTVDELIALQGIEEIWRLLPAGVQEYIRQLDAAVGKQKELEEYADGLYTATTRNAIADTIAEGFRQGKRSAEDFAGDFEEMMKEAILQSIRLQYLQEPLQEWYKSFSAAAADGLTEEEIIALRKAYNEIIRVAGEQLDAMGDATGLYLTGEAARRASGKGLESISQDSADALNGKLTAMVWYGEKIHGAALDLRQTVAEAIGLLGEIAVNTAYCRHLEAVGRNMEKMAKDMETIIRDGLPLKK